MGAQKSPHWLAHLGHVRNALGLMWTISSTYNNGRPSLMLRLMQGDQKQAGESLFRVSPSSDSAQYSDHTCYRLYDFCLVVRK